MRPLILHKQVNNLLLAVGDGGDSQGLPPLFSAQSARRSKQIGQRNPHTVHQARKGACALILCLLVGCSYNKPLGRVPHLDGSGYTEYRVMAGGGVLRPGVIVIVSQTLGSNPPVVLTQASGPPMAPNLLGNATGAATGLLAGYAIGRGSGDGDTTTIIQGEPPAPMMEPPKAPPKPPVHPPNGRPPDNRPPHRPKH